MLVCRCEGIHPLRRVVLTGGPGAGKTAVLELVRQTFCRHVRVLPEAAGIIYGGGFPREEDAEVRRAAQRAIYHVERELEAAGAVADPALVLCDRGTVDGAAYWPGPGELWEAVGTTHAAELARYGTVVHLRTPGPGLGYGRGNPLRTETMRQAAEIDERIARLWSGHPRVFTVDATRDFLVKAHAALVILRDEMPECCRPPEVALD